jgi:hypothetical protein
MLAPVMPWHAYAALTEADAADLAAFLKSPPPADHKVPGPFGPEEAPSAPYQTMAVPQ